MVYQQFEIWLADLHPNFGEEAGKIRPVVIVQADRLNRVKHPTTIICPLTTNVRNNTTILRVNVSGGESGLDKPSAIMIDQIRLVDKGRLLRKIGDLPQSLKGVVAENIALILDLDSFRQNQ